MIINFKDLQLDFWAKSFETRESQTCQGLSFNVAWTRGTLVYMAQEESLVAAHNLDISAGQVCHALGGMGGLRVSWRQGPRSKKLQIEVILLVKRKSY